MYVVGFLLLILAVTITLTIGWRPFLGARSRPLTNRHFDATQNRLARGEYLAQGVLGCIDCHTPMVNGQPERDKALGGGMEFKGTLGKRGEREYYA